MQPKDRLGGPLRRFAAYWITSSLLGIDFPTWCRLLARNQHRVAPRYCLRAAAITFAGLINSALKLFSAARYAPRIRAQQVSGPIFILGHWRSGTTFLHELLSYLPGVVAPNLFQVMNPHTFLLTEMVFSPLLEKVLSKTRIIDEMCLAADRPQEEEFALAQVTLMSPYIAYCFPVKWHEYDKYLTFQAESEQSAQKWQQAFDHFLKCILVRKHGTPLLKSPASTGRIKLLLDLYPDAKFIHISRNPYDIYRSTYNMLITSIPLTQLQAFDQSHIQNIVIGRLIDIYSSYCSDHGMIRSENILEICYEELVANPRRILHDILPFLEIDATEAFKAEINSYLEDMSEYKTNIHPSLSRKEKDIVKLRWEFYFKRFGYDMDFEEQGIFLENKW